MLLNWWSEPRRLVWHCAWITSTRTAPRAPGRITSPRTHSQHQGVYLQDTLDTCFNPGHQRRQFSRHLKKTILFQNPFTMRSGISKEQSPKGAPLVAQLVKNPTAMWETWIWSLRWEASWRRGRLPHPVFWPGEFHGLCSLWGRKESDVTERLSLQGPKGLPWWLTGKESTCKAGDAGSFTGLWRSPGEGNGNPFQYSCLEKPLDRGAWQATVHRVAKSQRRLSNRNNNKTKDS